MNLLALAVNLIGGMTVRLADLADPDCPPLTEVEIYCFAHGDGFRVHARCPIEGEQWRRWSSTCARQGDLLDVLAVAA